MARPSAETRLPPHTTLGAPSFDAECARVYARALDALDADGVPYLLGGALAVNAYTRIWRDTKDLDVFCKPDDAPRVLAALERAGFVTEVVYDSWLGKGWVDDIFVDVIWRNANGLFPVQDAWFRHKTTLPLFGRDAPIIPVEELILSKMMVGGRYRFDGADILHVIHAAHDRIDWRRVEDGAGEHAGLVLTYLHLYRWGYPGFAERVPARVMRSLEARAAREGSSFGPFRALLLDIQSYQVDVEGWNLPDPHELVLERIFGDSAGRS